MHRLSDAPAVRHPCRMLPDFRLETYFSKWEFRARFNLAGSDVESVSLHDLLALADDAGRDAWNRLHLGYTETFGSPALRGAIAEKYERIAPDQILCFAGAQEGIFCAMQALLSPDDHAVVVVPNYQSLEEVPLSTCDVSGVAMREDGEPVLDIDALEAALRANTRLIVMNFPNNPTGKTLDRVTFDRIIELARLRGIYLFSDEVYRGLEHDPARILPAAADRYERALSLGVMSKSYGLPGLRIGWIACQDVALLQRMERVKHYLSICNAGPSEVLATIALRSSEAILDRNRSLVRANVALVREFMQRHADLFGWSEPHGGCIAFPRYLGAEGVDAFCTAAVEESGVLLLPNEVYRSKLAPVPSDRFRIGFGRRNLPEALAQLELHLATVASR
jgi:aspartate/methionine/tyrosine aminotransferase